MLVFPFPNPGVGIPLNTGTVALSDSGSKRAGWGPARHAEWSPGHSGRHQPAFIESALMDADKVSVFVSYRREDSRHQAGRLYDHLVAHFGSEHVFKDVDSIPLGLDFREVLTERVAGCDVFIAVIGDAWLSIAGKSGTRRLDDPGDFVRIEIEAALSRKIPVIPVLVGDSSVPPAEELPESLRGLAFRNGLPVRPDPDFHHDVDRLVNGITRWFPPCGSIRLRAVPGLSDRRTGNPLETTSTKSRSHATSFGVSPTRSRRPHASWR